MYDYFLFQTFGGLEKIAYLCNVIVKIDKMNMDVTITKESAMQAWKKALRHKREAKQTFENWLTERGIEGKVVTL